MFDGLDWKIVCVGRARKGEPSSGEANLCCRGAAIDFGSEFFSLCLRPSRSEHLVVFGLRHARFDEAFIVTSTFAVLIGAGSHPRHAAF